MNTIKQLQLIDLFKDEYHLSESTDMMKYRLRKSPNRTSIIDDDVFLTDEEERNEQIVEQIARKYGLKYFQQSYISGTEQQMKALTLAREEISKYMEVSEIESPFTLNGYYTKCFSFYS